MQSLHIPQRPNRSNAPARDGPLTRIAWSLGRFVLHGVEMCLVMCASGIALSVLFFRGAALLGFSSLPQTAPELLVLVIAINLSLPMAAWMRFRGHDWRPTLEMAGATMTTGLGLIAAYRLELADRDQLIEVQTSLACPVMFAAMLVRFPLYASHRGNRPHMASRSREVVGSEHAADPGAAGGA